MDYTLKRASQYGVRLLITLSNYYTPFGGQQQYVDWYNEMNNANLGKSAFLTNATIKQWYKNMLDYVLNRENKLTGVKYKDDPTVFAWELCNEPEGTAALVNWAAEMSAYVKTIDSKHLVSVGDQGPLGGMTTTGPVSWDINGDGTVDALDYRADTTGDGKPDATYNLTKTGVGTNGYGYANSASHEQLIALPNVDFGTFHLYPDHWGVSKDVAVEYGVKYIQDHIALGQVYGKPTVAEEYGVMRPTLDESKRINRYLAFDMWNQAILDLNGSASMFWTLTGIEDGPDSDANGNYPDFDGFRVLNDGSEVPELLKQYARVFNGEQESIIRSDAIYLLTPVLSEISKASSITVEAKVVTVSNKVVDKVLLYVNTTKKSDGSVTKAAPADMAKLNSGVRENVYTKNLSITAIDPGDTYTVVSEVVYTDGTTLRTENRNIRRYIVEEMPAMHTIDFENGQKPSFTTFGSYQATLNSIAIDDTVHMLKLDITDGTEWSEHKVKFLGFPKTSGGLNLLPCTKKVSFELYYEKKSGTAGTFKPYIALEPNWVKTAIDLNRISVSAIETNAAKSDDDLSKRTDYDIKTIEGKDYYWMKITIEFLTDSTYNGLAVCPTTENLKVNGTAYSGICYMDNIVFYGYPDGILDAPIDPPADVEFYTA
jgi:mannan endo-1,4-beta-mannosidase